MGVRSSNTTGQCVLKHPVLVSFVVRQVRQIYAAEGTAGFFRGTLPRTLVHMPSVAVSWTTYETVKTWLLEPLSGGSQVSSETASSSR